MLLETAAISLPHQILLSVFAEDARDVDRVSVVDLPVLDFEQPAESERALFHVLWIIYSFSSFSVFRTFGRSRQLYSIAERKPSWIASFPCQENRFKNPRRHMCTSQQRECTFIFSFVFFVA